MTKYHIWTRKIITSSILLILSLSSMVWAQTSTGPIVVNGWLGLRPTTVAQLLAKHPAIFPAFAAVSNGANATDCATGGGTTYVACEWNGVAWSAIGGGGGAGNPGGPSLSVQINAAGVFGGYSEFNYNHGTTTLSVPNASVTTQLSLPALADGCLTSTSGVIGSAPCSASLLSSSNTWTGALNNFTGSEVTVAAPANPNDAVRKTDLDAVGIVDANGGSSGAFAYYQSAAAEVSGSPSMLDSGSQIQVSSSNGIQAPSLTTNGSGGGFWKPLRGTGFSAPSSGYSFLYVDSVTKKLTCVNDDASDCNPAATGTAGGTNGQVQYNNSTAFGGITNFLSDGTNVKFNEIVAPSPPSAGTQVAYAKAGVGLCTKNSSGTEFCPSTPLLTNTHIFVGNVSGLPADVAASGDVSLANTGAFTVSKINGTAFSGTNGNLVEFGSGNTPVDSTIAASSVTKTICSGTITLNPGATSSNTCSSAATGTCTGLATTDNIMVDFNSDPTGTTGYVPGAMGTIAKYPTTNTVNVKFCNNTGASITPSSITLNYRVVR